MSERIWYVPSCDDEFTVCEACDSVIDYCPGHGNSVVVRAIGDGLLLDRWIGDPDAATEVAKDMFEEWSDQSGVGIQVIDPKTGDVELEYIVL